MWVLPLGQKEPLEEEMATHSSILAWSHQSKEIVKASGPVKKWTDVQGSGLQGSNPSNLFPFPYFRIKFPEEQDSDVPETTNFHWSWLPLLPPCM